MKLTSNDLNHIMSKFPSVKLSYVKNIHKKVSSANIFLAIPKGGKYFAWFRNFKKYSVCIFLEVDKIHVFFEKVKNRDFERAKAQSLFNLFEISLSTSKNNGGNGIISL